MNESRRPPTEEGVLNREEKKNELLALLHGYNEADIFNFLKTNPEMKPVCLSPDVALAARGFLLQMFERYITIESIEEFLRHFHGIRDALSSTEIRTIATDRFHDESLRYSDWNPEEYKEFVDTWLRLFPDFEDPALGTTQTS